MILTAGDLPSNGEYIAAAAAKPIHLRPLNFIEILEYSNEVTGNSIKNYLRDLRWLIKLDPNVLGHSLYDLDYLIFMMKVHTIADNKDFQTDIECGTCKTPNRLDLTMADFQFIDVEPRSEMVSNVLLGGYKFKISVPTIGTFLEVLNTYNMYQKTERAEIPKLISLFPEFKTIPNDIEYAVFNSSREDIAILYMLETKYLSSTKPVKRTCTSCNKEGGMAIGIGSLIASMFRDVLLNNPIDDTQVQFE